MALNQQQKLNQSQRLSPLQLQYIKLIELNSLELEDRIKHEMDENPALECDEPDHALEAENELDTNDDDYLSQNDIILGDYLSEDDIPDHHFNHSSNNNKQSFLEFNQSNETSLHESLLTQIKLLHLDQRKQTIAEYIIGNLDENGYLLRDLPSISDDLLFQQGIEATSLQMEDVLYEIQDLEPAGVGARDLAECLLLQLERRQSTPATVLATTILTHYFDEFSRKHYDKIIQKLGITSEELRDAIDEIISLHPKPGNALGNSMQAKMNSITPDFIVESFNGEVVVYLNNSNIPLLKVSRHFADMLQGYDTNKEGMTEKDIQALLFMKQKVDAAKWFIDAIKQRQNTLQRTMEAIVSLQYDFFLTEDETRLKPMILKDVAEKAGYDISTISRVSNSKYVQTNTGIYPLKFFFSEAMQTNEGEDISSREIKRILKESIEAEDPSTPLTDEQLTEILNKKGYLIARRTVAKYREQLGILVARLRKGL